MHPHWAEPYSLPTVGDSIVLQCLTTVVDLKVVPKEISLRVSPGPRNEAHRSRAEAISELLRATHRTTSELMQTLLDERDVSRDALRVGLKNTLENHRSVLEYVSHYLAERCEPRPRGKVMFPIATESDTQESFEGKLRKWFPGLLENEPEAARILIDAQPFGSEWWLKRLADLNNYNKHESLSELETSTFHSLLLGVGGASLRVGELGFLSLEVGEEGEVKFVTSGGISKSIVGPASITRSGDCVNINPDLVRREHHSMIRIAGGAHSLAHEIWSISKNVFHMVEKICQRLSDPSRA